MKLIFYSCIIFALISCKEKPQSLSTEKTESAASELLIELTPEQLKQADVVTDFPVKRTMNSIIRVNGVVDVPPQSMISISFPLGGYLKSTHLLPGSRVTKGESIAVLEDPAYVQLQQDYLIAKAKIEFLSIDLERQKELSEQSASSKKTYQQVLTDYKIQDITMRSLEEKLKIIGINPMTLSSVNISRTVQVRSPINGYVAKVNVNIGKYLQPSDVLFELIDPNDIHAALSVYEKDIAHVQKGMKAVVSLIDYPDKTYEVEVILVTRNVDNTGSGIVHCHFERSNHDLLPGMYLTGALTLKAKQAIAVPEESVVRFEGKHYIFIQKNKSQFYLQSIQTGITENGYIEILDKNTDWSKQQIVTKNAYALLGKLKNTADED